MFAHRPAGHEVPGWRMATTVVRGAAHEGADRPLQDAAGAAADLAGAQWLALAVAGRHGGPRHFRGARGPELAVEVGLELLAAAPPSTPRTAVG